MTKKKSNEPQVIIYMVLISMHPWCVYSSKREPWFSGFVFQIFFTCQLGLSLIMKKVLVLLLWQCLKKVLIFFFYPNFLHFSSITYTHVKKLIRRVMYELEKNVVTLFLKYIVSIPCIPYKTHLIEFTH